MELKSMKGVILPPSDGDDSWTEHELPRDLRTFEDDTSAKIWTDAADTSSK